ncbi:MAG: FxsA family protein [Paracoccaceae bacterium]
MWLFLPLILWPLIEIGLFVTLGAWIGLWPTLAWVVGTAVLGGYVIRRQGERAQVAMRQGFVALSDPLSPMAQGAMMVAAGLLLILPGFLTDALGLLLLLAPVRAGLVALLSRRIVVAPARPPYRPDVIDGEFIDLDAERLTQRGGPSGWTRE